MKSNTAVQTKLHQQDDSIIFLSSLLPFSRCGGVEILSLSLAISRPSRKRNIYAQTHQSDSIGSLFHLFSIICNLIIDSSLSEY
jgi:hypothetical protein